MLNSIGTIRHLIQLIDLFMLSIFGCSTLMRFSIGFSSENRISKAEEKKTIRSKDVRIGVSSHPCGVRFAHDEHMQINTLYLCKCIKRFLIPQWTILCWAHTKYHCVLSWVLYYSFAGSSFRFEFTEFCMKVTKEKKI